MKKIYYKGVNYNGKSYYAWGNYEVIYDLQNPVVVAPKTGPIWIHDSLEVALAMNYSRLYRCYATRVRKPYNLITTNRIHFHDYWEVVAAAKKAHANIATTIRKAAALHIVGSTRPPEPDVRWADSITLIGEIQQ